MFRKNSISPSASATSKKNGGGVAEGDIRVSAGSKYAWNDTVNGQPPGGGLNPVKLDAGKLEENIEGKKGNARPGSATSGTRKSAWDRAHERYLAREREEKVAKQRRHQTVTIDDTEDELLQDGRFFGRKTLTRVFHSKKFQNVKLERLYQRYFFKLNQNNLMLLMGLLIILSGVLIFFHYGGGSLTVPKGVILGLIIVVLISLEVLCNWNSFSQRELLLCCYILLGVFVVITGVVSIDNDPRSASEGVWCTVFLIYMVYSLLPVRMRLAVISGITLAVIHIISSAVINRTDSFLWKQVRLCCFMNLCIHICL